MPRFAQAAHELDDERHLVSRKNKTMAKHLAHDSAVRDTLGKLAELERMTKEVLGGALTELSQSASEMVPSPPPAAPPPKPKSAAETHRAEMLRAAVLAQAARREKAKGRRRRRA